MKTAFDTGVNFFDTADVYSNGALGASCRRRRIKGCRATSWSIATKVFGRMSSARAAARKPRRPKQRAATSNANLWGLSRKHMFDAVDASLERLGLDYIDLYQVHAFDPVTPLEETLDALDDIVKSGQGALSRPLQFRGLADRQGAGDLGAPTASPASSRCRCIIRSPGATSSARSCRWRKDQELAILPWSPLAGGFLSGKFTRDGGRRRAARGASCSIFRRSTRSKAYDIIDAMKPIGDARDVSVAQIALAWLLHQKHVTSVIIGAKTEAQLADNIAATKVELSSDDLAKPRRSVEAEARISRLDARAPRRGSASRICPEIAGPHLDTHRAARR